MEPQRDVADVRALLLAHGPAILFQAIERASVEIAAAMPDDSAAEATLWENVALVAHHAAAPFLQEAPPAMTATEPVEAEGESTAAASPADDEDGGDDEGEDVEDDESEGEHDSAFDEDDKEEDERVIERPREGRTMAREDALGKPPSTAATWRLRFRSSPKENWTPMARRENDRFDTKEWPIRTLSLAAILREWPDLTGEISVQYMRKHDPSDKTPRVCGYSQAIPVRAATRSAKDMTESGVESAARVVSQAPPSAPQSMSFQEFMQWDAIQKVRRDEEYERRRREAEEEHQRCEVEEARRERRRRREREEALERDRLELKKLEIQARLSATRGPDVEALASRISAEFGQQIQSLTAQIQEAITERGEGESVAAPSPDPMSNVVNALREVFGPVVALVATKMANDNAGPGLASAPLSSPYQPRTGTGNGSE